MSYQDINDKILEDWESNTQEQGTFVKDGILYKGEIRKNLSEGSNAERDSGDEKTRWANASRRYLFLTKDMNDVEGNTEDIRPETGRHFEGDKQMRGRFYRMYMYLLYGIAHATPDGYPPFTDDGFSDEDAVDFFDEAALARINCKKVSGGDTIKDSELQHYIDKYGDYLGRQIKALDANIIVCCSWSNESSITFDFLNGGNCYDGIFKSDAEDGDTIYYDEESKKVALCTWHLSYYGLSERYMYEKIVGAYSRFLKRHPDFFVK